MTSSRLASGSHLVPRRKADRYMLIMLIGFAGSVLGTRAFLALTGYPQIGGGTLHIAHALWGGLLLFLAALLPLLVVNRAALLWAALLTGVGAGLFIDEVGKFITVDNDYFFPAAAPIAYAVFLLAVLGYLQVRGARAADPRTQLHAVLELLPDALDSGLSERNRTELQRRLEAVTAHPGAEPLQPLAQVLRGLTRPGVLPVRQRHLGRLSRAEVTVRSWADRTLTAGRLRTGLTIVLPALALLALSDLTVIVAIAVDLRDGATGQVLSTANEYARIDIQGRRGVLLLLVRAVLDAAVGAALLTAAVLLLRDAAERATGLAQTGLLASLSVVNLLVFYLEQFAAAVSALVQLAVLMAVQRYQQLRSDAPP